MLQLIQRIGRAFMVPVALLPAAGLFLGIGTAMQNVRLIEVLPFLKFGFIHALAIFMAQSGTVVFANLGLLFAVGVATGLTGDKGVAALASVIGYLVMNVVMGLAMPTNLSDVAYADMLGIHTLNTGVFGGIVIGLTAAYLYNKYYEVEFPDVLSFFAGARFIPIITFAAAIVVGLLLSVVWPPIGNAIGAFGNLIGGDSTNPGYIFVFGLVKRLLIPFGLHHIWYTPFWFTAAGGSWVGTDHVKYMGEVNIWFAQWAQHQPFTAGRFFDGEYVLYIFGFPGAAYAMYKAADKDKRAIVSGLLLSAALTSMITGITEPLEFSFIFAAPVLYFINGIYAGLSYMFMYMMHVHIGMTFSGGIIDLFLYGILPSLTGNPTNWFWVPVFGVGYFFLYYYTFLFIIKKFNYPTPGRGGDDNVALKTKADYQAAKGGSGSKATGADKEELQREIFKALGGTANIVTLDACMTRLRVTVKSMDLVSQPRLKGLGASGCSVLGKTNIQVIFGTKADQYKTKMKTMMERGDVIEAYSADEVVATPVVEEKKVVEKKSSFSKILVPIEGEIIRLEEVPDAVFAEKMMGEGFAIKPKNGNIYSPVDGEIAVVQDSKHAIALTSVDGDEIIIHFGIDTVSLGGEGFDVKVKVGDTVKAGDLLSVVDIKKIESKVPSIITPVLFTNLSEEDMVVTYGQAKAKEEGKIVKK